MCHAPCSLQSISTLHRSAARHTPIWILPSAILGKALSLPLHHFFIRKVEVLLTYLHELSEGLIS